MTFSWDAVRRGPDGRLILLYRHQRVLDEGIVRPGMDVLDVGGWGVLAQALIEAGARCTILDFFTADQAYPDRVRALPHVAGDARERHHFPPESFDVVTCFEMLEHCGDIEGVIANARYWLRPGGALVGTVPIPGRVHAEGEPGVEFLSGEQLYDLLDRVGFSVERVEPTGSVSADEEPCSIYFVARKPV